MIPARQSTAIIVTVGPVLDADGVAVTGSVVGDFKASKNGGAPAALNGSATLTHRHTGYYSLSLTTSDTDTVGSLEITCDDTVNACPIKEIQVLEEAIYDAIYAASANAFTGAAGSTKVSGVVLTDTVTTYTGNTPQTGDAFARLGAPAGASVSADVAAVKSQTAAIEVDTQDIQTKIGTPAGASVSVDIAAVKSQTAAIETDTQDIQGRLPAALDASGNIKAQVKGMDANTLTDAATAADFEDKIADKVWDEPIAGHAGAGSTGEQLAAAGAAGDPWATALPGAYGAGTAGKIVGDNLNASVSSVKAKTDLLPADPASETNVDAVETKVDGVKAKTDQFAFSQAGLVDSNVQKINDATILGDGTPGNLFRV